MCLPFHVPVSPSPGPLASAISTTMTESSFSCGLSSEMSECNVSVRYECTSRLTLGMPITTDTAGARRGDTGQGSGGQPLCPPLAPPGSRPYLPCGPGPPALRVADCSPWPAGVADGGRQWADEARACSRRSTASVADPLGGWERDRSDFAGPENSPALQTSMYPIPLELTS